MGKIKIIIMTFLLLAPSISSAGEKEGLVESLINLPGKILGAKTTPSAKESDAAKKKESPASAKAKAPRAGIDIRKIPDAELIKHLEGTLEYEEAILNFIPNLKKSKDENGKIFYIYEGTRLEDLGREKLEKLFTRVQNEAVRIRTERLNRQLESIRQAEQSRIAAQQASRIPAVVKPPQSQVPTAPPRTYSPPTPPPMPPRPPRR